MEFKYEDTNLGANYCTMLSAETQGTITLNSMYALKVFESFMMAMCDYAKVVKTKEKPVAVVVNDLKKNMLFALKVTYFDGTEDNAEGSWNPEFTFDPADVEDCVKYDISETAGIEMVIRRAAAQHRLKFNDPHAISLALRLFVKAVMNWLDENASEKEDTKVTFDIGNFGVSIKNGIKIMTFAPDEELSNLVKDDATLQAPRQ